MVSIETTGELCDLTEAAARLLHEEFPGFGFVVVCGQPNGALTAPITFAVTNLAPDEAGHLLDAATLQCLELGRWTGAR
jgi:hypothetical protein